MTDAVLVIDDPLVAATALDPLRGRILAALAEPGSATTVAHTLGLPRQQVNYHLRALETHGLVRVVEHRQRRGLTERVVQSVADSFLVAPAVLGEVAPRPERLDRLSTSYLIALGARLVSELTTLARAAAKASKTLPTLAIDTELRFANPVDRAAFSAELTTAITTLAARYHDENSAGGRWHRVIVACHPSPAPRQHTEENP